MTSSMVVGIEPGLDAHHHRLGRDGDRGRREQVVDHLHGLARGRAARRCRRTCRAPRSTGRSSSASGRGQAIIIASVPFSAPDGPPLTGASTAVMPFFASPSATSLATRGPVVERSTKTFDLAALDHAVLAERDRFHDVGRRQADQHGLALRGDIGRRGGALCAALLQPLHRGLVGVEHRDARSPRRAGGPPCGWPIRPTPMKPSCLSGILSSAVVLLRDRYQRDAVPERAWLVCGAMR